MTDHADQTPDRIARTAKRGERALSAEDGYKNAIWAGEDELINWITCSL